MARPNALYNLWLSIARARQNAVALSEASTGRHWSFKALAEEVELARAQTRGRLCYPAGMGPEFVITLLRGWREGWVTCPIENTGEKPYFDTFPPGCAHLKVTSATTGVPRVVTFTEAQLKADVDHIMTTMGLQPEWPNVAAISLAHSYGFSNLILPLVLHGVPLILAGGSLPEQARRAAAMAKDVVLPAVPALWRAWHEAGAIPSNIKVAISAGAPLPVTLEQEIFQRSRLKVHNFYGSTECGGIAHDASAVPREDGQYAGQPMCGVSLAVNDQSCLEVRGPNVGQTYWPEPSDELRNGVFRTKDLAEIKEGKVFLKGRASDQINIAGRKVAPEAIERVLQTHTAVRGCVVFGVPDDSTGRGELIVAAVELHSSDELELLKQHAQNILPGWQVPREWWLLDSLGTNDRGKISRVQLAQQFRRRIKYAD